MSLPHQPTSHITTFITTLTSYHRLIQHLASTIPPSLLHQQPLQPHHHHQYSATTIPTTPTNINHFHHHSFHHHTTTTKPAVGITIHDEALHPHRHHHDHHFLTFGAWGAGYSTATVTTISPLPSSPLKTRTRTLASLPSAFNKCFSPVHRSQQH